MNVKRWVFALVSYFMLTHAVMQRCVSLTSRTSYNASLGGAQNRLHQVNKSVTELEHHLKESYYSTTRWDRMLKRRSYHISGTNVDCISSSQAMCRRCTDGTVFLECIDGTGRRRSLQNCHHLLRPRLTETLVQISRNETTEMFSLPNAISCCATLYSLNRCTCVENFVNGSDCTQCISGYFGTNCVPCACSSHGMCLDGRLGNGSCVCHSGWGGINCSKELHYTIIEKLLVPDGSAEDYLGSGSVGLSSDGSFLAATSWSDDDLSLDSGSVFVWRWNGSSYAYIQKLLAPDGIASDDFGHDGVSLSSDGFVLAAASHGDDDGYTNRGAVYVWRWNGTLFTYVQKLLAPDGAANDYLGLGGVTLSSDGTFLVAASPYDDDLGSASGSVYVWRWNESLYTYLHKLLTPDGAAGDSLGYGGVSLSSDGSFLAAASYNTDDDLGIHNGSVNIWRWNGTSFVYTQKILAPDGAENDNLGPSGVRLSGDGSVLAAAGYWDEDVDITSSSVYVWRSNGTLFEYMQELIAPDSGAYDALGLGRVSLSEDGTYLAVTSHGVDDRDNSSGSVHVWHWNGAYEYVQNLLAPNGAADDVLEFGSVSLSSDGSFLVAASYRDDVAYSDSGSMYVALLGWIENSVSEDCVKTISDTSSCFCAFPYSGEACEECLPNYFGNNCTQCSCSSNGLCADGRSGNGTCMCDERWTGSTCSECSKGYFGSSCDPCPIGCGLHGLCSDGISGNGSCICNEGWNGTRCDLCAVDYYGSNCTACLCKRGVCLDGLENNGSCACDGGWNGTYCDVCASNYYGANCTICECMHGTCLDGLTGDGSCVCDVGWSGSTCNVCALGWNGTLCDECALGWNGTLCNECASGYYGSACLACSSCSGHGSCNDGITGNGECVCSEGFLGSTCDVQKLLAPDGASNDMLGHDGASLSGDGSILAAASHGDDDEGSNSGSLYVWRWNSTIEQFDYLQKLLAPDGAQYEELGYGGATLSDDGSVLAAGARYDDGQGSSSGSLYVWRWNPTAEQFDFLQKLLAPDGASDDMLGHGGASLTGDGSVLAAASHDDDGDEGSSSGSLYVWRWNSNAEQFDYLQKLLAPDGAANDRLGYGGATLSGDGSVLAAGSRSDDGQGSSSGSLYVWRWNSTAEQFDYSQKLLAPDGASDDMLGDGGASLSGDGSVLAAASHGDDGDEGSSSGSLYVWRWNSNAEQFDYLQKLLAPNGALDDELGQGGATLNGDGSVLAAGSRSDDGQGPKSGSLSVWRWNSTAEQFDYSQKLLAPDGAAGDIFGYGGASLSGDGSMLAAGSHSDDGQGSKSGSLYLWYLQ